MAENYVQIRIKASDTAKPELDSLRADLDELGSKVESAKVDVNDEDAKRKLLEINAQLAALNKRVDSPKIDTASAARAESQIEKLKGDVGDLVSKVDSSNSSSGGRGLLAKLMFGAKGIEGAGGGGGSFLGIGGGGGGMLAGVAALVPAIEAAVVEAAGLVSGFAAAGAGAGAFAALAVPAFDKVKTAYTNVTAAQAAYHKAQLTEQMDPTKSNAAAVAKALLNLKESWHGLDPAERGAVHGLQDFMGTYQKMVRAFEPQAFRVFNDGLKIANELLPHLTPFANTFANVLDGLLKQAGKFAASKGFTDWLKQFHSLEGPAVAAIGHGIGQVVIQFGKLLTVMSKKDVVHAINIAFDILVDTIKTLIFIVRGLMRSWDQLSSAFRRVRHDIAADAHEIAHVFDDLRHDAANLAHNMASHFDQIRANIHRWAADVGRDASRVVSWFRALPGRIMSVLSSLPGRLFSFGAHIISMLAKGIASAIGDVTGAIGSVVGEITSHLPFSPAKKGPLSGRGDPALAGKRITSMLATGMESGAGAVSAAADRVAGAAAMGGRGGRGGQIMLEFHVPTALAAQLPPQFWTAFANGVRAKGGSPGIVTRKVSFA